MKHFKFLFLVLIMVFSLSLIGCRYCLKKENSFGYINVDEGKLFYKKFGSGKPIVILHGGPGHLDHTYLLPQMLDLAKDYELIFYDQRGSGKSLDAKIDSDYVNLDQFAKDLDQLQKTLGLKQFVLMGHSWGGLLAMYYATKYPEALSSLILLNSCPANYNGCQAFISEMTSRTKHIAQKISPLFDCEALEKLNANQVNETIETLFSVYFYNQEDLKQLTIKMDKESVLSGCKVANEMAKTVWLNEAFDLLPALKSMLVPTLIVHGEQDVIPISTAKEIENTISNSTAVYFDRCGHFPYIEKSQELFSSIRNFLAKK